METNDTSLEMPQVQSTSEMPAAPALSADDRRSAGRRRSDRRGVMDRRTGMDRRRGPGRRRNEDRRSAEEGEMTDEQFEFIMAINEYKKVNRRPFPTWTEVLDVMKALGYRKIAEPQDIR